jgi:hypothetical protein
MTPASIETLTKEELTNILSYAGLVLVAFELIKSLIVNPIKVFATSWTRLMPKT